MDPDLERLVADMSVTRTPPPRRNEGGLGNVGRNEPGTLDDDSTAAGHAFTVFSNGHDGSTVPRVVNLGEGQAEILVNQTSNGKRDKIFVVPDWNNGFSTYCFQFIGQGASFCTAKNCTTSHHHASTKKEVVPGELYVCKSSSTAFVTPSISSVVIDNKVLIKWSSLSLLLQEWNEKFFIATNAADEAPASTAAMEVQETFFRTKALNFKTPAKHKRHQEDGDLLAPSLLDVSTYSPFFKEDQEVPISDIGHVADILARLDQGVTTNNESVINLVTDYRQEHLKVGDALHSMWLHIEALTTRV
jgi:hypothetical protein